MDPAGETSLPLSGSLGHPAPRSGPPRSRGSAPSSWRHRAMGSARGSPCRASASRRTLLESRSLRRRKAGGSRAGTGATQQDGCCAPNASCASAGPHRGARAPPRTRRSWGRRRSRGSGRPARWRPGRSLGAALPFPQCLSRRRPASDDRASPAAAREPRRCRGNTRARTPPTGRGSSTGAAGANQTASRGGRPAAIALRGLGGLDRARTHLGARAASYCVIRWMRSPARSTSRSSGHVDIPAWRTMRRSRSLPTSLRSRVSASQPRSPWCTSCAASSSDLSASASRITSPCTTATEASRSRRTVGAERSARLARRRTRPGSENPRKRNWRSLGLCRHPTVASCVRASTCCARLSRIVPPRTSPRTSMTSSTYRSNDR